MSAHRFVRTLSRAAAVTAGVAAGIYGGYVGVTWLRYGHPPAPAGADRDELLDQFMPVYDVVERHTAAIAAPEEVTLATARDADLFDSPLVRGIFKAREVILGASPDARLRPHGIFDELRSLGWVMLAEIPGREIVLGAVTRPWEANVTFRGVPAAEFAAFAEPRYVKIVFTLRADPAGAGRSIFRTETRAVATDAFARGKFRRYWAFASPGIFLIRWLSLSPLKAEAERRAHS